MHIIKHFITITKHRHKVMRYCFKLGLVWQGLTHDLSKYSAAEFWAGAKYYQGNRSPQAKEREEKGYSSAWLHHKGRNKHHYEYWFDSLPEGKCAIEMPKKYFGEMICDRLAASKIYKGKEYTNSSPLEYFQSRKDKSIMHPHTAEKLEYFLILLSTDGEKAMFKELKRYIKEK